MKTIPSNSIERIRLRIDTEEQAEKIQKICMHSNIGWVTSGFNILPFDEVSIYIIIDTKAKQLSNTTDTFTTHNTDDFIEEYFNEEDTQKPKTKRIIGLGWIYKLENGMEILVPEKEGANLLILKKAVKENL